MQNSSHLRKGWRNTEAMARRETRRESDALKAPLEGRSAEDRQRLAADHRSFLAGERDTDADFGPDVAPSSGPAAAPVHVARAAAPPRRPPMGKAAAYLAALKKRKEEVEVEEGGGQADGKKGRAKGKRPTSTKPRKGAASKKTKAATAREEKAAQEAVAVTRAAAEASRKALVRMKERLRVGEGGAEARAAALARVEEKKLPAAKKGKTIKKATASSTDKPKKRKTSPHAVGVDADNANEVSSSPQTRTPLRYGTLVHAGLYNMLILSHAVCQTHVQL